MKCCTIYGIWQLPNVRSLDNRFLLVNDRVIDKLLNLSVGNNLSIWKIGGRWTENGVLVCNLNLSCLKTNKGRKKIISESHCNQRTQPHLHLLR